MPAVNSSMPVSRHTRWSVVKISTSDTSLTAPAVGAAGLLIDAQDYPNGIIWLASKCQAAGTTATNKIRFFARSPDNAWFLLGEKSIAAKTPSDSVEAANDVYRPEEFTVIPYGYRIYATTDNAETWCIQTWAADMERDTED